MRRFMWIYGLSLIVVFPWRIMQVFESKAIFVIIDFYPFGRVTKDGKTKAFLGDSFRLLRSELVSLLMIFCYLYHGKVEV